MTIPGNSQVFSKSMRDQDPEGSTELSRTVTSLLDDLPEPVDPSVILDRLVDTGLLRRWLDPLYGELVYTRTAKGRQLLEFLQQEPANNGYPDTGESGETYNVEHGGRP
jgi:hypothetical protein